MKMLVLSSLIFFGASVALADCKSQVETSINETLLTQAINEANAKSESPEVVVEWFKSKSAHFVKKAYAQDIGKPDFDSVNHLENLQGIVTFFKVDICTPRAACGNEILVGVDAQCEILSVRADNR